MKLLIVAIVLCLVVATYSERIVGGFPTTIDKYPWQISLRKNGNHNCGGTIYNARTIITAAHCLDASASSLSILYGSTNAFYSITGQTIQVQDKIIHPSYSSITLNNDIGILKLASDIQFSNVAQPIPIHIDHSNKLVGQRVESSGWGALTVGGYSPNQLYAVDMPVIPRSESNYTLNIAYNDESMMIAGRPGEGKDTCQGDSGGPLIWRGHDTNPVTLVGIVSWGKSCGWSGVYTRVSRYVSWIKDNI